MSITYDVSKQKGSSRWYPPTRSRLPRCLLARWEIRSRRFMPPPS